MTKVIYEAPRPRYVVQNQSIWDSWFDLAGFSDPELALEAADAERRRNPGTSYRVIDTSVDDE